MVFGPTPPDPLRDLPAQCLARFSRVGKKRIAWAQTGLCGLFGVGDPGPGLPEPPSPVTRDPNPWSGHTKHDTRNADNSRHGVSGSRPKPPLPPSLPPSPTPPRPPTLSLSCVWRGKGGGLGFGRLPETPCLELLAFRVSCFVCPLHGFGSRVTADGGSGRPGPGSPTPINPHSPVWA